MRRLAVAELVLVLLAAALSALLVLLLLCRRRSSSSSSKPTQLPVSEEPRRPLPSRPASKEERALRRRVLLALRRLCLRFRRRTRVEPAGTTSPAPDARQQVAAVLPEDQDDVAAWSERWFGAGPAVAAVSRALYTIDEEEEEPSMMSDGESEGGEHRQEEPETPFYTPPASPPATGVDLT